MKIPLAKPFWGKREEKAAIEALRRSSGAGDGPFSKKLVEKLKALTGAKFVFPVTSCTHGLELSMVALGIGSGDEVILPSFTMTSTANCVVLAGGKPVFADIEDTYYNLDPDDVSRRITPKTRGIIVVHYAGMPCQMEKILSLAKRFNLFVVEDAAHAIGATYKGQSLGTFGDIGVYSFHGTKNVSCGEGGAVLTNDKRLAEKMEIYRVNGTNRAAFLAGIVDKYSWVGKGSSFLLCDILANIVTSQIEQISEICKKRTQIAYFYIKELSIYQSLIHLPRVPEGALPNWHIFAIRFKKVAHRNTFLGAMRKKGIDVAYHYVPLHSSKMGQTLHDQKIKLPVTDRVSQTLIRLPIYPGLTGRALDYIISTAQRVLRRLR